jgi:eukaryotic-like serine/threonine-protein kinase
MSGEERETDRPPSGQDSLPTRRFERIRQVNRGGIGCIDVARDPVLGRRVAIKVLRPELEGNEPAAQKFEEEAQITGQLEHPNIVPIYDLGMDESGPFIVMKLIRGQSLAEMIAEVRGRPEQPGLLPRFIEITMKLCDALSFAHSRGVIHCDLKPENVMVGDFGQVYLMDWGVALLASGRTPVSPPSSTKLAKPPSELFDPCDDESLVRVASEAAATSKVWGTPAYMAPEQVSARSEAIDERTDVFGLGGVLHEILTGKPPNDWQRLHGPGLNHALDPLPAKSDLWPQLPPELCRITLKALAPNSDLRYPTVAALRADLEQFMKGGGWFETRVFEAGQVIVEEGAPGDAAYIIDSGHCEVWKTIRSERVLLRRLGPGEVFGETAVLTRGARTASVVAVDNVTLKVITGESLNRELDQNPWLGAFMRSLAVLFRETDQRLSDPGAPTRPGG